MNQAALPPAPKPVHVPDDRVYPFNMYDIPGGTQDLQMAYVAVRKNAPADIFWTPLNGGHWVATRGADVEAMLRDTEHFSSRCVSIPKSPDEAPRLLPIESDPPLHTDLRKPLTRLLMPKVISDLEPKIRALTNSLIDQFIDRGECDFVKEFAAILPIAIFLDLVELPFEDNYALKEHVTTSMQATRPEVRLAAQGEILKYLSVPVMERQQNPGEDLLSKIVNMEVNGERLSPEQATLYASVVMNAGLDTVAAMLSFFVRFLATHPEHRKQLLDHLGDDAYLRRAVDELIRRHGIANLGREITRDMEYKGNTFKKGEMIVPLFILVGLDEEIIADPLEVDFQRAQAGRHAAFGQGPHNCPGAPLAKLELKIFIEEWLRRIPEFRIKEGSTPTIAVGAVSGFSSLDLSW